MTRAAARALAVVAALCAASPADARSAADLYYERTLMVAADGRCDLFEPRTAAALAAARAQARGAALRSGQTQAAMEQLDRRARARAAGVACASPDLAVASGRVRAAFDGYSRLQIMTYPGDIAGWTADRAASAKVATWRLSQTARFGPDSLVFGVGGRGDDRAAVLATASFADGRQPYSARLVARDVTRATEPRIGRAAAKPRAAVPLAQRVPPRTATLTIIADARVRAETLLLPQGARTGVTFRFPKGTADMLERLDPREAVAVEFLFSNRGGDEVRSAYVEVGDFAAARAFADLAAR